MKAFPWKIPSFPFIRGLLLLLPSLAVFYYLSSSLLNIAIFFLSWLWHFALVHPDRLSYLKRRYRFSFMKMILSFHLFLEKKLATRLFPFLIRLLSPSLFCTLLILFTAEGNIFYSLCGSLLFEINSFIFESSGNYR